MPESIETMRSSAHMTMPLITTSSSPHRYSPVAQLLHWSTAILVLAAFIYGPGGSEQRVYAAARDAERALHETLGVAVWVLAALRLAWRRITPPPPSVDMPLWMHRLSRMTQNLLYGLLLAVPLSAIAGAWLTGHPVQLLGAVTFRPLLAESHAIGSTIAEIHTWLGDTILWLAGLHAAASIYHHGVRKDGVLVSMLPRWIAARRPG